MHVNRLLPGALAALLCFLSGCTNGGFLNFGKAEFPKASVKNPAVKVIGFWQEGNGPGEDNKTCRGFAGQIWFLTPESAIPAMVDGSVDIYLFDDQGTPEENDKPIRKFHFPTEVWALHRMKTPNGLAYGVFIPYVRPGNHEAQCTLYVRFTPREGEVLTSKPENVALSGAKKKLSAQEVFADVEYEDREIGEKVDAAMKQVFANRASRNSAKSGSPIQQASAVAPADATAHTLGSIRAPRRAVEPLTPEYEAKLIREERARQEGRPVEAVDDEPIVRRPSRRPLQVPLDEDDDEAVAAPRRGSQTSGRATHRPLDEEETADDESDEAPAARASGKGNRSQASERPATRRKTLALDDED